MRVDEYAHHDATALAELISGGEVSAAEVREAALAALGAVDHELHAVAHGPFADAADPEPGPFAGVPFAIKDTLMEAGRPLEFGSRLLEGFVAPRDVTLTERFRAAGLVSLARTATPEFAFNVDTAPDLRGPTRNPWDLDRSAGGSSGGAAALVASGALPMAHGNDGGGSIRLPAAYCGLVGLKPSRGRVPMGPLIGEPAGGVAHEFALTRTVRDTAALLDAVAGPAPGDRYYVAGPATPYAEVIAAEPGPLRIAVHTESAFGRPTDPEVRATVNAVAAALEELGHHIEPVEPPIDPPALERMHLTVWSLFVHGIAAAFGRAMSRTPGPAFLEAATLACYDHGRALTVRDVTSAAAIQNAIGRRWGAFLDDHDLFLCPTTPTTAQPVGEPDQNGPQYTTAQAWIAEVFSRTPFTPIANTTGQPSISLPLGMGADAMPIGVMLTAQTLREDLLLQVAAQLERALPWADRRPT